MARSSPLIWAIFRFLFTLTGSQLVNSKSASTPGAAISWLDSLPKLNLKILLGPASPSCSAEPDVTLDVLKAWAEMMDIEYVHLTENTTSEELIKDLRVNDLL